MVSNEFNPGKVLSLFAAKKLVDSVPVLNGLFKQLPDELTYQGLGLVNAMLLAPAAKELNKRLGIRHITDNLSDKLTGRRNPKADANKTEPTAATTAPQTPAAAAPVENAALRTQLFNQSILALAEQSGMAFKLQTTNGVMIDVLVTDDKKFTIKDQKGFNAEMILANTLLNRTEIFDVNGKPLIGPELAKMSAAGTTVATPAATTPAAPAATASAPKPAEKPVEKPAEKPAEKPVAAADNSELAERLAGIARAQWNHTIKNGATARTVDWTKLLGGKEKEYDATAYTNFVATIAGQKNRLPTADELETFLKTKTPADIAALDSKTKGMKVAATGGTNLTGTTQRYGGPGTKVPTSDGPVPVKSSEVDKTLDMAQAMRIGEKVALNTGAPAVQPSLTKIAKPTTAPAFVPADVAVVVAPNGNIAYPQ